MKKFLSLIAIAAIAAIPCGAFAAAEAQVENYEACVYADVLSAYVFNGQVGNDEPVFQPGLDVSAPYGFGFSLWANMDLTDNDPAGDPYAAGTGGKWSEIDLGLSWTLPIESILSFTVGGTYYVYPQSSSDVSEDGEASAAPADGSYEVWAKVGVDCLLQPSIKFAHDLDDANDWVALLSIGHSFDLMDALSLDLGATLGYGGEYYIQSNYGADDDLNADLTHAQVTAGLNYALCDALSLGLKAGYSSILSEDVRDSIEDNETYPEVDIFFGGVSVAYTF